MSKKLLEYVALPVEADWMGIYVFDTDPKSQKMLLQSIGEHLPDRVQSLLSVAFARAFNELCSSIEKRELFEDDIRKYISLPVIGDGKGNVILDNEGRKIMSVRGYGWIQYKTDSEEEAIKMQIELSNLFVKAFNKKYPI